MGVVETSHQKYTNKAYLAANIVIDDQNPRCPYDHESHTWRWWSGDGCQGGAPVSVCNNLFVVVAFPEVTTAGSLEFVTYQDSYGPWKMRISSATAQAGPYQNAQDFDELPSKTNAVGNTGLPGRDHGWFCAPCGTRPAQQCQDYNEAQPFVETGTNGHTVPRNVLNFDPPLTGRFFKIQILENHGATSAGLYRVYFKGP
jgi:hypothetical protein